MSTFPNTNNIPSLGPNQWGGGAIVWVGNRSGLPAGDGSTRKYPLSSLFGASGGLAKAASLDKVANAADGSGCTIVVLPGHVESIAASTSLSTLMGTSATGVNVIGMGNGNQRPLFNWTAAASALLVNLAGTWFRNVKFNLSATAATVVTAAITTSAADCGFEDVEILPATSATQLTTTAITAASGSTRLTLRRVNVNSETFATNPTDIFTTTAAIDQLTLEDCQFLTAVSTTTNGVINLANAPTNVRIIRGVYNNKKASSTKAAVASASTTGSVENGTFIIQTTGAGAAFGTVGNLALRENYGCTIGLFGIIIGTTST